MPNEYIADSCVFEASEYKTETSTKKGVLRTIRGPLAEWGNLNRNKRLYSEKLWDRVLESPYVKEQSSYKTLYGEANHPTGRFEIDFERVSHSVVEMVKVPEKKQIWGTIDILDTPLGRVLNTLYEYGSVLGFSSRAGGVLHKKKDYVEVDEDTYQFITFDAVPYPSVESARLVAEGAQLDESSRISISEEAHNKLCEIINNSSVNDKEILKSFIYELREYDLDKEIAVLEGINSDDNKLDGKVLQDTTLCLLKESYRDRLKLSEENTSLKEKVQKLEETLNGGQEASQKLAEAQERCQLLEGENQRLSSRVEEVEGDNKTLRTTLSLVEEVSLDKELYESEVLELRKTVEVLKVNSKDSKAKDETILQLREEVDKVTGENTSLTTRVGELESQLAEYKDTEVELGRVIQESISANDHLEQVRKDSESATESLKLVSEENATLRAKVEELSNLNQQLEKKLTEVKEEVPSKTGEAVAEAVKEAVEKAEGEASLKVKEITEAKDLEIKAYREELVKTVSGVYGISSSAVLESLDGDYDINKIYTVCEKIALSSRSGSDRVITVEGGNEVVKEETSNDSARVEKIYDSSSSRRGR